jgi:hypothetical protein
MDVFGPNQERFTEKDIYSPVKLAQMRTMELRKTDKSIVIPVDHPTKKHFRVLGGAYGEIDARGPKLETHDKCVDYLEKRLAFAKDAFRITSFVLKGDVQINTFSGRPTPKNGAKPVRDLQAIFKPLPGANYAWYRGPSSRARFDDQRYIEPDLCGRPAVSFQPTNENPGIIIEVIRTHAPDEPTFARLFKLSKTAHFVIFYIIPDDDEESQHNRLWPEGGILDLRVTFYLVNGRFYESGIEIPWTGSTQTHRYQQCVKGVLERAKHEAISKEKARRLAAVREAKDGEAAKT